MTLARTRILDDPGAVARAAADLLAEEVARPARDRPRPAHRAHADPASTTSWPPATSRGGSTSASRAASTWTSSSCRPKTRGPSAPSWPSTRGGARGCAASAARSRTAPRADLEAECLRYERVISDRGGLGVAILGVGMDGHIAYNMPGPMTLATHVVRLPDGLAASLGVPPEDWPLRAITMGIGTIRAARRILVLATGESKATAVQAARPRARRSGMAVLVPAAHPDLDLIADPAPRRASPRARSGRARRPPVVSAYMPSPKLAPAVLAAAALLAQQVAARATRDALFLSYSRRLAVAVRHGGGGDALARRRRRIVTRDGAMAAGPRRSRRVAGQRRPARRRMAAVDGLAVRGRPRAVPARGGVRGRRSCPASGCCWESGSIRIRRSGPSARWGRAPTRGR